MRLMLGLAVLSAVVLGCSRAAPSLVGTWITEGETRGLPTRTEATFGADGSYRGVTEYLEKDRVKLISTNTGSYRFEDGRLTLKLADVDWTFPDKADESARLARDTFAQNKQAVLDSVNNAGPIQVRWLTPDEVQLSVNEGAFTYRRKK